MTEAQAHQTDQHAAPPSAPAVLTSATREIAKATHVQLTVPVPSSGQALVKHAFARELGLRPGEVGDAETLLRDAGVRVEASTTDLLRGFEAGTGPDAAELVDASVADLTRLGDAVAELRGRALTEALEDPDATTTQVGQARQRVRNAAIAVGALAANTRATPLGMLNLERLEMAPAGLQRGELIATIPLAPLEETAVSHKEWSVLSKEFTSIVTDSLENTSETGVTDNTELSQATTSQAQHSNQFNVTGSVSGGIPVISGSASSGFTAQDSTSQSATTSTKHATELTKKASARTKQEHKITISTTTVTGSEEQSTRTIRNPSSTEAMRVDYFSLMRKWRVRLYRYGLRLTYDLVIPEPGAGLRKAHKQLADLRGGVGPFVFGLPHNEITADTRPGEAQPHHRVLAERYGAVVPDPPLLPAPVERTATTVPSFDEPGIYTMDPLEIPDGYRIRTLTLWYALTSQTGDENRFSIAVLGSSYTNSGTQGQFGPIELTSAQWKGFMLHATGKVVVSFALGHNRNTQLKLVAELEEIPTVLDPDPRNPPLSTVVKERWQAAVWNALRDAAQTQYFERQQDIAAKTAVLAEKIENVDTLTLRREENEEIMKGVVRFLLGPDFAFMPPDVVAAFKKAGVDLEHGIGFDGNELGLDASSWATVREHESVIRFVNQAIEWENVVTFLYSYFWDTPQSWEFIRQLQHPDSTRQAFLRSGSARVVLTVRKGWETAWVAFAEGGFKTPPVVPDPQYLSIAKEIAAYDDRNYPGIPPANPGRSAVRLEDAAYTTTSAVLPKSASPVTFRVGSTDGFLVGAQVVLDSADKLDPADGSVVQETTVITAIPDSSRLTVASTARAHDGSAAPFAVLQPGTKGALIAEWNEYTPSSGTDIEIGSNLGTTV
ncbi:hypothetical protein [Amycolatopsis kentuckyensis]|uniref:hypothetical protein n=1 Tax=Amycolatopsis kentuckyensis TaxID=218823 RepID=UPI00356A8E54